MHACVECLSCLKNLSLKTITLALGEKLSAKKRGKYIKKGILNILESSFATSKVPAAIFTDINRKIKKLSNSYAPFKKHKDVEINTARKISHNAIKNYTLTLKDLLRFSAAGNSLDFFKDINETAKEMRSNINFTIDKTPVFKKALKKAKIALFSADSSGEMFFDLPLAEFISQRAKVYYAVKSHPIQNDLTIKDFKKNQNKNISFKVISSGNDAVGIELSTISKILKHKLAKCDIILAKGMGYYETFTELPQFKSKVFYLLMAKCAPAAKNLGVPLNSYVFSNF